MIEILDPRTDACRIDEVFRPECGMRYVDGWETARSELAAMDAFSPNPPNWYDEEFVEHSSRYIVYPWRSTVVRLPSNEHFYRLRTARNRYLLDDEEQQRWGSALIGVAGLSVGASVVSVCGLTGARRFRIADPDILGPSNLNRLQSSVCDLGLSKVVLAQRRLLENDPYSDIAAHPDGYDPHDDNFLGTTPGTQTVSVVVEEMDDLALKVVIRHQARASRIPVVMATDNGDNVILDVERFDIDPDYPLFHGRAGELAGMGASELNDPANRVRIASAIVGSDVTPRTRYSLTQVGRSLPSWPQLGTAANAAGSVAALATRSIVLGADMRSGRYRIDLDRILLGDEAASATRWNELDEHAFAALMRRS